MRVKVSNCRFYQIENSIATHWLHIQPKAYLDKIFPKTVYYDNVYDILKIKCCKVAKGNAASADNHLWNENPPFQRDINWCRGLVASNEMSLR